MKKTRSCPVCGTSLLAPLLLLLLGFAAAARAEAPLSVATTTPELGTLARTIGGEAVSVTVFAKPGEDAHFVQAKPSFIRQLAAADLFIVNGLSIEVGWAPALLQGARNNAVKPGAPGYLDVSSAIDPLEKPAQLLDRSYGDVHPEGNPHYLLDPLNGLYASRLITKKLSELRPGQADAFSARLSSFERALKDAAAGPALSARYDVEKLLELHQYGKLTAFMEERGERDALGGWLGKLAPYYGQKVVVDHNLWPYFARRFGLKITGALEPKPGIPPTVRHLEEVIAGMKQNDARVILANPYYDRRHAEFVAGKTGAQIALLAHQAGSRDGTDDYLRMIDYNVTTLARAFATAAGRAS